MWISPLKVILTHEGQSLLSIAKKRQSGFPLFHVISKKIDDDKSLTTNGTTDCKVTNIEFQRKDFDAIRRVYFSSNFHKHTVYSPSQCLKQWKYYYSSDSNVRHIWGFPFMKSSSPTILYKSRLTLSNSSEKNQGKRGVVGKNKSFNTYCNFPCSNFDLESLTLKEGMDCFLILLQLGYFAEASTILHKMSYVSNSNQRNVTNPVRISRDFVSNMYNQHMQSENTFFFNELHGTISHSVDMGIVDSLRFIASKLIEALEIKFHLSQLKEYSRLEYESTSGKKSSMDNIDGFSFLCCLPYLLIRKLLIKTLEGLLVAPLGIVTLIEKIQYILEISRFSPRSGNLLFLLSVYQHMCFPTSFSSHDPVGIWRNSSGGEPFIFPLSYGKKILDVVTGLTNCEIYALIKMTDMTNDFLFSTANSNTNSSDGVNLKDNSSILKKNKVNNREIHLSPPFKTLLIKSKPYWKILLRVNSKKSRRYWHRLVHRHYLARLSSKSTEKCVPSLEKPQKYPKAWNLYGLEIGLWEKLRKEVLDKLNSGKEKRREISNWLLSYPCLICYLRLSPIYVFKVFAISKSSRNSVVVYSFYMHLSRLVFFLFQRAQHLDMALCGWLHFSTKNKYTNKIFRRFPFLADKLLISACLVMRGGGNKKQVSNYKPLPLWMGHQTLALLSAIPADVVIPWHWIISGAAIMDCGVFFRYLIQSFKSQACFPLPLQMWISHLIRSFSKKNDVKKSVLITKEIWDLWHLSHPELPLSFVKINSLISISQPSQNKLLGIYFALQLTSNSKLILLLMKLWENEEYQRIFLLYPCSDSYYYDDKIQQSNIQQTKPMQFSLEQAFTCWLSDFFNSELLKSILAHSYGNISFSHPMIPYTLSKRQKFLYYSENDSDTENYSV